MGEGELRQGDHGQYLEALQNPVAHALQAGIGEQAVG
jgi:hypothetical protein